MKKKDIINLINAKKAIEKNSDLLKSIKTYNGYLKEEEWLPYSEKYKEQFNILKKELLDALKETKEAENIVDNTKCNHEVRLKHCGFLWSEYECVICGKNASSDNLVDWFQSFYRNNYTVSFNNKYQNYEDVYYTYEDGKTKEEVINMILKLLAKYNDEDEVDLVNEFSKLKISGMDINKEPRKEENYILIIGGTNTMCLDSNEEIYVKKNYKSSTIDFLHFFNQLLNTKIAIIENSNTLMRKEFIKQEKNKYLKFCNYNTLIELHNNISNLKTVPFKLIIDLTDLYDYQFNNDVFSIKKYILNLKEFFPSCQIIKIPKLSSKSLQELKEFLLSQKITTYANIDEDYYYINDNEVSKANLEEACQNIKSLLRKK